MEICKGREVFISFLTPDSEVYVDEPVKFIARKEDTAGMIANHAALVRFVSPRNPIRLMIIANNNPAKNPFNENLLPGIHGSNAGVITIPEK